MNRRVRSLVLSRITGLIVAAALAGIGSCGSSPLVVCDNSGQVGIRLFVVDTATSAPPPGAAVLIVADGAYADTLPSAAGDYVAPLGVFVWTANRPGSYTLTLRVPGYHEWFAAPVVVARDSGPCNRVVPVTLTARVYQDPGTD